MFYLFIIYIFILFLISIFVKTAYQWTQFGVPVVARVLQFENPKVFISHQIIVSNLNNVILAGSRHFRKKREYLNGKINEPEH